MENCEFCSDAYANNISLNKSVHYFFIVSATVSHCSKCHNDIPYNHTIKHECFEKTPNKTNLAGIGRVLDL